MSKKSKIIIGFMVVVTILDILISVIGLKLFPITSIVIDSALVILLLKYSKQNENIQINSDESISSQNLANKLGLKQIVLYFLIPFVILAVVATYVIYQFI